MPENSDIESVADAVRGNWVDRFAPDWLKPYARMARWDRPIGWWLLLWPCWWSVALASGKAGYVVPSPWLLLLFMIGAIVMRGAGCTYNDIVDRDIDDKVARTRSRPIPSGAITVAQAKIFLVLQCLAGLAVLLQFNRFAVLLGISSLLIVAIYPFMKRITHWPQFVLGLAFSWGALMGWAAIFGSLAFAPALLYLGGIAWTIGYDTIYAHQDKDDDAIIGVRSTALLFGEKTKSWLTGFYGLATLLFAMAMGLAGVGIAGFVGLAVATIHLMWQISTLDIRNSDRCLMQFKSNTGYGWILFGALVLDGLIRNA